MTRTLSQEELDRYDRDGYLVIHDAVPPARLREVIAETERMYRIGLHKGKRTNPKVRTHQDPSSQTTNPPCVRSPEKRLSGERSTRGGTPLVNGLTMNRRKYMNSNNVKDHPLFYLTIQLFLLPA